MTIKNITAKVTSNNGVYAQYENDAGEKLDFTFRSWSTFITWIAAENRKHRNLTVKEEKDDANK